MDYLSPFLGAISEGTQVVQHLNAAAQQQEQLAEQKRQFDIEQTLRRKQYESGQTNQNFQQQLGLLNSGAQPVQPGANGTMTRMMPPIQGGAPGIPDVPSAPGAADPGRVISAPGGGGQFYVPTQQEQFQQELGNKVNETQAVQAAKSYKFGLPDNFADVIGMPRGSSVTLEHPPTLQEMAQVGKASKEAPERPAKTSVTLTDQDANLLGVKAGQEMPIDEYRARTQMYSDQARAKRDEATARRQDALIAKGAAGPADKAATPAQLRQVRAGFDKSLKDSKGKLEKDLKEGVSSDDVRGAYRDHISRMQDAQNAYESELSTVMGGKDIPHNDWADKEMAQWEAHNAQQQAGPAAAKSPAAAPAQAQPAAQAQPQQAPAQQAQPQHKVGDMVSYQGKPHKVTQVTKDGKLVLAPQ